MLRAYELARSQHPHPNPKVGSVVVSASGDVLAEGAHGGPGEPHAEVVALERAGGGRGSTVYVSLEPCSHQGRTPPCAERLVSEGVAKVVVGTIDPDPRVSGRGVGMLRRAGIEVEVLEDPAAREVDPAYFHHRDTGLPLVTWKFAMTLDGAVAAADGTSQWITSEEARADAHSLRAEADAVVVGAGTLRMDDPRLDVRLTGDRRHQPRAVIVAGTSRLPREARIWSRSPLVLASSDIDIPTGDLVIVEGDLRPDPEAACRALAAAGLLAVLLEGGPTLAATWLRAKMVSRGVAYVGAKLGGGGGIAPLGGVFATLADASPVDITEMRPVGDDVRIDFRVRN